MLPNTNTHTFLNASSRLGLEQSSGSTDKTKRAPRKTAATRSGLEWDAVTILRDHATTPNVKCNYCGDSFAGGATRIRAHLIDKCACDSEAFCKIKEKLLAKQDGKDDAKRQKKAEAETDAAAEGPPDVKPDVA